jgi:hypothetical protein
MKRPALEPGDSLDGFVVDGVLHAGAMARIYVVHFANGARDPGFPDGDEGAAHGARRRPETIVGFETEHRGCCRS